MQKIAYEKPDSPEYGRALGKYRELLSLVENRRTQVDGFADWLERKTNWLIAPASTKFHLNIPGGLLIHSVGVTETLLKVRGCMCPEYSDETCAIVGIFHDVGKVGSEGIPHYLPNPDMHKSDVQPYIRNPELVAMGIGVRSLYTVARFVELSDEEAQAICYHDGQYVPDNRVVALKERRLLLMLHYADLWTAQVIEI